MIFITGASSGLGASLAKLYAEQGEALTLTGRNSKRLTALQDLLQQPSTRNANKSTSCTSRIIKADLSCPEQASMAVCALSAPPKMIIHCAGSGLFGSLETQSPDSIKELFNSNVLTTTYLLQQVVQRFKHDPVRVVIIMSTAAQVAKAGESTYCAAKWAVKGLVESVRLELKGYPMQLVCVYPGGMDTPFWSTSGKALDASSFMHPDEAAIMIKQALGQTEHGYVSDITVNRH